MRRGLALARDYARRRVAFGAPLSEKPLHVDTLADIQAEYEAAFHLAFRAVELLGREEAGELARDDEARLLRLLTPLAKLTTGKQAVAVRERGPRELRRRRLRRGHRAAAAAARRAGAADLGGDDQRAVARRARARCARARVDALHEDATALAAATADAELAAAGAHGAGRDRERAHLGGSNRRARDRRCSKRARAGSR